MTDASSYLKFISSDNKVILNSSSLFYGDLDRNIMDFMNDEEELLLLLKRIPLRMHILQLVKIFLLLTLQPPLTSVSWKRLLIKKYDGYVAWKNNKSLLSSASEGVTI